MLCCDVLCCAVLLCCAVVLLCCCAVLLCCCAVLPSALCCVMLWSGAVSIDLSPPPPPQVSLEDLDYMEVTVLAHRKILLKAIEDLRQNKRVTKQLFAPAASIAQPQPQPAVSTDDSKVGRVTPEKQQGILVSGVWG
jgi:hypothetical protein